MDRAINELINLEIERLREKYRGSPDPSRRDWISFIVECLGRAERVSDEGAGLAYAMCMVEAAAIAVMAAEDTRGDQ